jgi:RNA polymerase sigma factor (sigma-70 family)
MIIGRRATTSLPGREAAVHSARLVTSLEQAASGPSLDLAGLVEAVRRGDADAFPELYRRLAPAIFDYLVGLMRDRVEAEDLLQETFLKAWRDLTGLREPGKVATWLYSVARHAAVERLRSGTAQLPLDSVPGLEAPSPTPEVAALSGEAVQLVWTAASSLEPQHREALNLSLRHGLTYREIGDVLGLPATRANELLVRSREALGRAVRVLFVVRSAAACPDLRALAPLGAESLTVDQRRAVDYHMRHCDACRDLGLRLTKPEELFGAAILAALPATAQHVRVVPAGPPPGSPPSHPGSGAAGQAQHPSLLSRSVRGVAQHRSAAAIFGGALLLTIIAGVVGNQSVLSPPAPLPSSVIPTSPPAPASVTLWNTGLSDLGDLTSYQIQYQALGPVVIGVTAFDITVGPPGSWYGTVIDARQPGYPLTLAEENGHLYVQGGPNFVAVAPDLFSLTTAQAQSLGSQWLLVDSIQSASDGTLLDTSIAPFATPQELTDEFPAPAGTPSISIITVNGQKLTQLSDDGETVDVLAGTTPYLVSVDESQVATCTVGAFNQPVTPPDVSGALTWLQLTGGSPGP